MMILCGQSNAIWHYWAGKYPGKVGYLFGPAHMDRQTPREWMPFACDNDAYIAHTQNKEWDESAWFSMIDKVRLFRIRPLWMLVPDVVANKKKTLENWKIYAPTVKDFYFPAAFCVQDGMTLDDVPSDADVVFVGGSTEWKWRTVEMWSKNFGRVHVGRVNSVWRVEQCEDWGVESVDGSGWFREPSRPDKLPALARWMDGKRNPKTQELQLA